MSWITTDDPVRDAAIRDAEHDAWLRSRPVCVICGERIQEEHALHLGGDEWMCERCVRENTCYIG